MEVHWAQPDAVAADRRHPSLAEAVQQHPQTQDRHAVQPRIGDTHLLAAQSRPVDDGPPRLEGHTRADSLQHRSGDLGVGDVGHIVDL